MGKNYCPACGSHEVDFAENGMECLECGFKSKEFPEEHMLIEGEEEDSVLDKVKQSRKKIIEEDEEMEDMDMEKTKKSKSKGKAKKAKSKAKKSVKKGRKK